MSEISNFIKTIMAEDLESGKVSSIVTRFQYVSKHLVLVGI